MISNEIFNYYEFLEKEDDNYQGNSEIIDDGSEALYCILFKLMGDARTFESLCSDFLDWPTATELKYSAQDGEYSSVVDMMRENDCGMLENGALMEISQKIISDLEKCIPDFVARVGSGESVKDPEFLEQVWQKLYG
jgi:hypothetical protein